MGEEIGRIARIWRRHGQTTIITGGIVASIYGWWKLQENPVFVKPEERREFPFITIYKHMKAFMGLGEHPEKPHRSIK